MWPVTSLRGRESMRKEALEMKNKNEEDEKEGVKWQKERDKPVALKRHRLQNGSFQGQRVKGPNHPLLICSQASPGRSSPGCPWRWSECFWDSVAWDEPWGPEKRVLPLCPRYHILVRILQCPIFCWSRLKAWTWLNHLFLPWSKDEWSQKPGHEVSSCKGSGDSFSLFEPHLPLL